MTKSTLDPNRSYTFSNYFDLGIIPSELVTEFGYTLSKQMLKLPEYAGKLDRLANLQQRIEEVLPYIDSENETTRREFMIAPIVADLIYYSHAHVRIEYNLKLSNQLQGSLDYYLATNSGVVIIEAKQADLSRGFGQLAVELIALDQWTDSDQPELLGAVTTGNIWQFGVLQRSQKHILQVLNLYRVTEDIEAVMRILLAALLS
ncbi:MAG: hypothetical protein HC916_00815 [Coleofasciculaceae cyanobacterium SM2_1_6]|nr:hypothetical protein [Coleofasciculaceae cyanobacterium SM2_1_6]